MTKMYRPGLATALILIATLLATSARSEDAMRPPVGGVVSPEGAMVFFAARGRPGDCGPNCAEWIAAEGAVEWDTFKRLIAYLDRYRDHKGPLVIDVLGRSTFSAAMSMGRIIRERKLDTTAGGTVLTKCALATDRACAELRLRGEALDARIETAVECPFACVLMLAGGVHRSLPRDAATVLRGMQVTNVRGLNISEERKEGLQTLFDGQMRRYLKEMGVSEQIVDVVEHDTENHSATRLSWDDCKKLGLITEPAL